MAPKDRLQAPTELLKVVSQNGWPRNLDRPTLARYLSEVHGIPCTPKTAANWAAQGKGPRLRYRGNKPYSTPEWADNWAHNEAWSDVSPTSRKAREQRLLMQGADGRPAGRRRIDPLSTERQDPPVPSVAAEAGVPPANHHSEARLRDWYRKTYVPSKKAEGVIPSRDDDWKAAKYELGPGVPRDCVYACRKDLAPKSWKRRGRRRKLTKEIDEGN